MYKHICAQCKVEFCSVHKNGKFCKSECYHRWQRTDNNLRRGKYTKRIKVSCKECHADFEYIPCPSRIKKYGRAKYCSSVCRGKAHRGERHPNWGKGNKKVKQVAVRKWNRLYNCHRVTLSDVQEIIKKQKNKCPVCNVQISIEDFNCNDVYGPFGLVIDHDHSCCNGKDGRSCGKCVRGILHNHCNIGLGHLKDNPVFCKNAAKYLEKCMALKLKVKASGSDIKKVLAGVSGGRGLSVVKQGNKNLQAREGEGSAVDESSIRKDHDFGRLPEYSPAENPFGMDSSSVKHEMRAATDTEKQRRKNNLKRDFSKRWGAYLDPIGVTNR